MKRKEYKWIVIEECGRSNSGKTLIFRVFNKDYSDVDLGIIKWNGGYRKYAFYPDGNSYYEEDYLRNIAEFLEELKNETK